MKYTFSDELATELVSEIKVEYIVGTNCVGLKTYMQVVANSYDLIK
jgi:hypothetical protein